jgi:hypothetical protein
MGRRHLEILPLTTDRLKRYALLPKKSEVLFPFLSVFLSDLYVIREIDRRN